MSHRLELCFLTVDVTQELLERVVYTQKYFLYIEAPWLILPVVICLSQRLSHACLSARQIKVKPRMAH